MKPTLLPSHQPIELNTVNPMKMHSFGMDPALVRPRYCSTVQVNVPHHGASTVTLSPALSAPTPSGVPV